MIASVTRPFCGDCDRVRLTADGQVRNCLFAREESDLRGALRGGADDAEIARRWQAAMLTKRPGHGIDDVDVPAAQPPDVGHRRLTRPACRVHTARHATGQNDPMRLFAAIVPPRPVLDEVRAVVDSVRPCRGAGAEAGPVLPARRARARRRGADQRRADAAARRR